MNCRLSELKAKSEISERAFQQIMFIADLLGRYRVRDVAICNESFTQTQEQKIKVRLENGTRFTLKIETEFEEYV